MWSEMGREDGVCYQSKSIEGGRNAVLWKGLAWKAIEGLWKLERLRYTPRC